MNKSARHLRSGPQTSAYEQLRNQIISGQFSPETQLSEPALAKMLGLSRTPVREALSFLVAEGLVVRLPSGRAIVASVSVKEIQNIYDVRARLEGLVARDASLRITGPSRQELERKVVLMERLSDDYVEVVRIGGEFHQQLVDISENTVCSNLLKMIRGHADRYRAFTTREPGRSTSAAREHREVFEALVSGSPDKAEVAMRHHIDEAGKTAADWAEKWLKSHDTSGSTDRPQ